MKRLTAQTVILVLLALVVGVGQGAAQEPTRLETLSIALWPEYDREGVLVIQRGTVSDGTSLPVTLRFRVPKSLDHLGGTAGVDAQGVFHYYQPTVQDQGDFYLVSYSVPYPTFQFEYYDGGLEVDGEARHFAFTYTAGYPVGALTLEAQVPAEAADFHTDPAGTPAEDPLGSGLPVHRWAVGTVEAGEKITWAVQYRKADDRLSAAILGLPTPGTSQYEDVDASSGAPAPWLLRAGAAAVALAAVGLWFGVLRQRRQVPPPPPKPARKRRKKPRERPAASTSPAGRLALYCHQCGSPLDEDDRFCARCGTPRKGR